MPITHSNLWPRIATFENIFNAYNAAAQGRRYKAAVLGYRRHLEENIINALNLLIWKQWSPSRFREFYVHDPKKRLISAPPFKDRVVHHALVRVIAPLFERKFIADSFACRVGKGTHAAKERVEAFTADAHAKWGEYHVLKGDIKAYFHSINRSVLLRLIERTIADKDVLWLIRRVIECDGEEEGIPIGALTSQLFANVYLDALDHHLKDDLGVKMYVRYMDDFVVIHQDRTYLRTLLADIDTFITKKLKLTLNPKTQIFKSGAGECHAVDFCGYRIWPGFTKPRKRTVKCARKRFKKLSTLYREGKIDLSKLSASITSFLGYMRHCSGAATVESVMGSIALTRS
jgi:retron-type reverse transcriptase